jgi:hypothetical protein
MMMSTGRFLTVLSALVGGALIALGAAPAKAGGDCWDCYAEQPPVIYKTYKKRIQVEPGVYEVVRTPSVYGWAVPIDPKTKQPIGEGRRVLLKPYKNISVYSRAQHIHTRERVAIQPEPIGERYWWDRLFDY